MATELTLAVDIGIGFTAAAVTIDGRSQALEIGGHAAVRSPVGLDSAGRLVAGPAAAALATATPDRISRQPLRAFEQGERVRLGDGEVPTGELMSTLLRWIADEAAASAGGVRPSRVVLTAPVRWTSSEVERLRAAAMRAGLPEPLLVPEPVAAARWHASRAPIAPGALVAVYDLGAASLTTTILTRRGDGFEIVGEPGGNPRFGGEDVDEALLRLLADRLRAADPRAWETVVADGGPTGQRALAELRESVRAAKEALAGAESWQVRVPGSAGVLTLTRRDLEAAAAGPLRASVDELVRTVTAAGRRPAELSEILLVGGSSRLPLVAPIITQVTGLRPRTVPDPKTAMPLGALLTVGALGSLGAPADLAKTPSDPNATRIVTEGRGTDGYGAGAGLAAGVGMAGALASSTNEAPTELAGNTYPPPGGYPPPGLSATPPGQYPAPTGPQFPPPGGYPPPPGPGGYPPPGGPGYQSYPGSFPTAPVPPVPPRRSNRQIGIIAAAVVVVVLAVAIPLILLSSPGSKKPSSTPIATGLTTTAPAPTPAPPTTLAPTTPSLTGAELTLEDQLDASALNGCKANPADENTNISASLVCEANDGREVTALQYRSLAAHNTDVASRSQGVPDDGSDCTDGKPSVETWHYNSSPETSVGALVCFQRDGNFVIFWTYRDKLLGFLAHDVDPTTIAQFWKSFEAVQQ